MNKDTNMDPINKERDVDQWLESALSQYGKAEPRVGLESRVLANVQAERNRIASRRPWWWAIGTAAALAAVVAVVWVGENSRKRNPASVVETSTTTQHEEARRAIQPGPAPHSANTAKESAQSRPARRPIGDLVVASTPKLDQFPSRRNMSEGESLLAQRLKEQSNKEALLEFTPIPEEVDLSIDDLEIRPLEIPDIEISESKTN
jgi:hypothetical protein